MSEELVRLSKVMSQRGLCSRREADVWIEKGWVYVDGNLINELGYKIHPSQQIEISKKAIHEQNQLITVLINKPIGYVSGQAEEGYIPAIKLITLENYWTENNPKFDGKFNFLKGLAPCGRLDIDSTGLLVLSQDGRVAKNLIGENSQIEKEYLVRYEGHITGEKLSLLNFGLSLDGQQLKPATVTILNDDQLMFKLKEGKKRQIRRMCELVDLKVVGLKRVRIGHIKLGQLPLGKWRFLTSLETF
ncbi:MAG: pseudouridylate synthase [Ferrovum sp. 37-45-19]|jgi:23S rRNA pseudouridine2604 synthase|uniref:pseudouridine synthase n=1 Tax=Ferrovum sp. JA12 TaxID=1356299 RepID=UPI00070273CD|nr:pseudouridine synthase [Ferrovum sp. JA12]OYV80295.1 MAG: pseudouridylate synthase [Ferrovum sp. 21-44-67]OYV95041.1 MAG: pseudouridylate synthase [Ferrovum sp. 37-45-19]OZB32203.1 MAG: pseudouridylate synthase [Ferrovum sp. 34-44-207]HQT80903.1 pseudouridine synthase [Ferrovaceae bacterium]KRH78745.1 ribosomal large subunit pseudouridine synthase F [Ferrovum sp. JA12]